MKLSIQIYLAGRSLSNTVSILDIFGVQRARSTVHNGVHKADLQPTAGHEPNHVLTDETLVQFNDEDYWQYAAVAPETNELLLHGLSRPQTAFLHSSFSPNSGRNTTLTTQRFLSMARIR